MNKKEDDTWVEANEASKKASEAAIKAYGSYHPTRLEYFAAHALTGLLSNPEYEKQFGNSRVSDVAVTAAIMTIDVLHKEQKHGR